MLKVAWHPLYAHPLPEGHRFPMEKYMLLPEQLLYEGTLEQSNFFTPIPMATASILQVHSSVYWDKLERLALSPSEIRRTGFPLSEALVMRERVIMHGTVEAMSYALRYGVAMNIAGGTHHAFADRGEGFCLLNDLALSASHYLLQFPDSRVLIVDLDVHQGNGTAALFEHTDKVFTFSMHGANNYPLVKERSDLDVPLPDGTDDAHYLPLLATHLESLMDQVAPGLVLFQAGVDILQTDKLGKLRITREGCRTRDRLVLESCKRHKVPVVVSMGGGYSPRVAEVVEAHANTFRMAQELYF